MFFVYASAIDSVSARVIQGLRAQGALMGPDNNGSKGAVVVCTVCVCTACGGSATDELIADGVIIEGDSGTLHRLEAHIG